MSAPCVTSALMAAPWFSPAAHISAVCPCQVSGRVDVGAAIEQGGHHVGAAGAGGRHRGWFRRRARRRSAFAPALSSARAMTALPLVGGERQGRDAVAVGGADVRAGADQQLRRLGVVRPDGPVKSRHAVRLGGVDRGACSGACGRWRDRPPSRRRSRLVPAPAALRLMADGGQPEQRPSTSALTLTCACMADRDSARADAELVDLAVVLVGDRHAAGSRRASPSSPGCAGCPRRCRRGRRRAASGC